MATDSHLLFPFIIIRDDDDNIVGFYSSHLRSYFALPDYLADLHTFSELEKFLRDSVKQAMVKCVTTYTAIPIPFEFKRLQNMGLQRKKNRDVLIILDLSYPIKSGFFFKTLPVIGSLMNLYTTGVLCLITLMSLQITFLQITNNEKASQLIAIVSSCSQFFIQMLLYFNDAPNVLAYIGRKMDVYIAGEKEISQDFLYLFPMSFKFLYKTCSLILSVFLFIFVIVSSIADIQTNFALYEDASEHNLNYFSFTTFATLIISAAALRIIPYLAILSGFSAKQLSKLENWLLKRLPWESMIIEMSPLLGHSERTFQPSPSHCTVAPVPTINRASSSRTRLLSSIP